MQAGDKITVPVFTYKGKIIDDPYYRLGEIMTEVESKDRKVKYFKVKLYHALNDGYKYVIIKQEKGGILVLPDFKIKRRKKIKTQRLPIFNGK